MSLLSIHPEVEISHDGTMVTNTCVATHIYDPLLSPRLWRWLRWQTAGRKMQQRGLVQTRASSVAAGQHNCVHQQTSCQQLNWAGFQEHSCAEEGEGISVQRILLFATGLLWFFGS